MVMVMKTERLPLIVFGQIVEDSIDIGNASGIELLMALEHRILGRCEHCIKATQHSERQHDALVLRWAVRTA